MNKITLKPAAVKLLPGKLRRWGNSVVLAALKLSDWLDNTFFPEPATKADRYMRECRDIEESAARLKQDIKHCYSMRYSYELQDRIYEWRMGWGKQPYAATWAASLMTELRDKQNEILHKM